VIPGGTAVRVPGYIGVKPGVSKGVGDRHCSVGGPPLKRNVEGYGMMGPGEKLGSPWPLLAIRSFLDMQGVINPGQYGFRAGHSTAMTIQDMVERVRGAGNSKKAFNTVDHGVLLAKLEHYGVRGEVLGLLGSYLRGRFQYVVYNGGESSRWVAKCGVPQG
jgi:hypothetical protein